MDENDNEPIVVIVISGQGGNAPRTTAAEREQRRQREAEVMGPFLHDEQRRLNEGDYWVSWADFDGKTDDPLLIFGRVADLDDYVLSMTKKGVDTDAITRRVAVARERLAQHRLIGWSYSRLQPQGIGHDPHAFMCWPITEEMFNAAAEFEFDHRLFPSWLVSHLDITRHAFLAHYRLNREASAAAIKAAVES